jgi:WXG100 family type VII secretion target
MAQTSGSSGDAAQAPPAPPIETSYDIFNPGGDPGVLRACAAAWRGMASELKTTRDSLDQQVNALGPAWTGAAATAFHQHWNHTRGQIDDSLPNFEKVAQQLDQAADAIEKVNNQIHEILLQIAATTAIGIGLSIITVGVSDAAAAAGDAAEAAEAGAEVARLGRTLKVIAEAIEALKDMMESSRLLKFGVTFSENFAANFGGNILGQELAGQGIQWGQDFQNALVSSWVGTKLSGLGSDVATDMTPGLAQDVLNGEGLVGGMLNNAITSAAGTAAADGVNGLEGQQGITFGPDVLFSAAGGLAGGAAGHSAQEAGDKVIGPILRNIAAYGAGGAFESDVTSGVDPQKPVDPDPSLVDPRGAYKHG